MRVDQDKAERELRDLTSDAESIASHIKKQLRMAYSRGWHDCWDAVLLLANQVKERDHERTTD